MTLDRDRAATHSSLGWALQEEGRLTEANAIGISPTVAAQGCGLLIDRGNVTLSNVVGERRPTTV